MNPSKKGRIIIKPFKHHQVAMDPNYATNTWTLLKNAIHEIHRKNASGLSFEELYRNAYNMVLHKYGDQLYNGLREVVEQHLKDVAVQVITANDEKFLPTLNDVWNDHHQSMLMIRDILMYMDRVYVVHNNALTVYDLGLLLFKDNVVKSPKIGPRLIRILLDSVQRERGGEVINRGLIANIVRVLVDLAPPGSKQKSVYEEDFEKPFLDESAIFYRNESGAFILSNSASEYAKKVEIRLREELDRVAHYLDAGTENKIRSVVEAELLETHLKALVEMPGSGMISMLKDDKVDDLARMYRLLGRVQRGHALMKQTFEDHVKEVGKDVVNQPGNQTKSKALEYVQDLLQVKTKYDNILINAFSNDRGFQHKLHAAFEFFINSNPKSPEFISLFIDTHLAKDSKIPEEEIEAVLDKAMQLFRFLSDKDIFEKHYKNHLAKRLLSNRSASVDSERSMVARLKAECGNALTAKLEGMFQDIKTSAETIVGFKQFLNGLQVNPLADIEINVNVLTAGYWPTQPASCNLPPTLSKCCAEFQKYYLSRHNGRKMIWLANLGSGDLRSLFAELTKRHDLSVNTYQICILFLFNTRNTLTFAEIQQLTGINAVDLRRNLFALVQPKTKILNKEPFTKKMMDDDTYTFNEAFKGKTIRVKVIPGPEPETPVERSAANQRTESERQHQIDAAIVRIMKSRKSLQHATLIEEVIKQLSSRFQPNVLAIKKRIESLIEREYLQRSADDRKVYTYLA